MTTAATMAPSSPSQIDAFKVFERDLGGIKIPSNVEDFMNKGKFGYTVLTKTKHDGQIKHTYSVYKPSSALAILFNRIANLFRFRVVLYDVKRENPRF